jgi:hypothetical protein
MVVDQWFFHGVPFYDTDSEKALNWHIPLPISIEGHFTGYKEDSSSPIFDDPRHPNMIEVCEVFSMVI